MAINDLYAAANYIIDQLDGRTPLLPFRKLFNGNLSNRERAAIAKLVLNCFAARIHNDEHARMVQRKNAQAMKESKRKW